MARQYFDDGSSIETYDDGSTIAYDTAGDLTSSTPSPYGANASPSFGRDVAEARQLQPFAQDATKPWWESMAIYGFTRAIDNHYNVARTPTGSQPATFAGQNGNTYQQGRIQSPFAGPQGNGNMMMLLIIGGVALAMA